MPNKYQRYKYWLAFTVNPESNFACQAPLFLALQVKSDRHQPPWRARCMGLRSVNASFLNDISAITTLDCNMQSADREWPHRGKLCSFNYI